MEAVDLESISVAESLVALSHSALKISCPTPIPTKTPKLEPTSDQMLGQDCSPTSVGDIWRYPRLRALSVASTVSDGSDFMDIEGSLSLDLMKASTISSSHSGRYIGAYSPEARRKRIEKFLEKRKRRVWAKKVDYDVRKNFADSRLRVKGRFVRKEDEELLCTMISLT